MGACTAADSVLLATSAGMVTRFHTDDAQLRPRSRAARGVTAMRLRPGESLVSAQNLHLQRAHGAVLHLHSQVPCERESQGCGSHEGPDWCIMHMGACWAGPARLQCQQRGRHVPAAVWVAGAALAQQQQ